MRKITLTIVIFLIMTISLILIYPKEEKEILDTNKESNNSFISMMLESDIGSNKFVEKTDLKFPLEGYHFNSEESGCENGGTLTWNSEKQKIEASLITSDKCYAYFDNVQVKSEFDYTGNYEEYVVPSTGTYKIELWGAQGGDFEGYKGGKGAYTTGNIKLKKGEKLYIYVGNISETKNIASFNGGGADNDSYGGAGGGATDVRLTEGEWNNFDSLKSRIMVAAGGGGANNRNIHLYEEYYYGAGNGGYGGALKGGDGESPDETHTNPDTGKTYGWTYGKGASQIAGGGIENYCDHACDINNFTGTGKFGYAVTGQSGGGSGYYGGGSAAHGGAGGGSSFISGYPGCDAIAENSTEDAIIHTNQPVHYSDKVFTASEMIAGNSLMPSPEGGTEAGHTGNGYAKITLIS